MKQLLFLLLAGMAVPGLAPAQTTSSQALDALLAEVRQLRAAMERSSTITPLIQLLLQRLQIQDAKVSRLARDLQEIRSSASDASRDLSRFNAEIAIADRRIRAEQNPQLQKQLEDQLAHVKAGSEEIKAREQQLRIREADVATQLQSEQSKLDGLEARLNSLEKQLESGRL